MRFMTLALASRRPAKKFRKQRDSGHPLARRPVAVWELLELTAPGRRRPRSRNGARATMPRGKLTSSQNQIRGCGSADALSTKACLTDTALLGIPTPLIILLECGLSGSGLIFRGSTTDDKQGGYKCDKQLGHAHGQPLRHLSARHKRKVSPASARTPKAKYPPRLGRPQS